MKKKISEMQKKMKKVWMTAAMVMGLTLTCANGTLVVNAAECSSVGESVIQEAYAAGGCDAEKGTEKEKDSDKLPDNGDEKGKGDEKNPETDSDGDGNGDGVPYISPEQNGAAEF